MTTVLLAIITAIAGVLGSNGIWSYLASKNHNNSAEHKALMGLLHNRICELCEKYIVRGYVLEWEYEDLVDYIYKPYKLLNGNGTAEKLIKEIEKIPLLTEAPKEKGV